MERFLAVSGMTAFETESVESCRSLGMDSAGHFRPVSLVQIWPECASQVLPSFAALAL
jgi:ABC-type amino acid transport system permease subunit